MNTLKLFLSVISLVTLPTTALATVWQHELDPLVDVKIPSAYTFTHDLTLSGFTPGFDTITGFTLKVNVRDDDSDSRFLPFEFAFLNIPGLLGDVIQYNVSTPLVSGGSLLALIELNSIGQLTATLSPWLGVGDFYYTSSVLEATGNEGQRSVPEPTPLALLGLGLTALLVARSRKQAL
jgi:hypothetical protein